MTPLSLTIDRGVATLTLDQPGKPVVVLDQELVQRLEAAMKALPRDLRGFVLASASRVFVAGADLKAIAELSDADLHRYLEHASRVFQMIADLPCPSAAAINGAALGGGLELAMHCDGLIAAPPMPGKDGAVRPYPIGLPEAGLCICPGWGGTNLLPARMAPLEAITRTALGKPLTYDEAVAARVFDAVAPSPGELLATARAWVLKQPMKPTTMLDGAPSRWIGRVGVGAGPAGVLRALNTARDELMGAPDDPKRMAIEACLEAIDVGLSQGWKAALACERRHLVLLRNTPAGKAAIAAFFAKK